MDAYEVNSTKPEAVAKLLIQMERINRMATIARTPKPTKGLVNKLFFLWVLILPFSFLTALATGIIAADKALAPLLLALGLFRMTTASRQRQRFIIFHISIATVFLVVTNISLIADTGVFWTQMGVAAVNMGYFLLPILFIRDIHYFRTASSMIIIITMLACLSAFLVSVGLLTLPYERFAVSRLGLEYLPKSVGILSNYGDMALLCSFTVLLTAALPKQDYLFGSGSRTVKTLVMFIVLLGVIGAQSRSVAFSILIGLLSYRFLKFFLKKSRGRQAAKGMMTASLAILTATILIVAAPSLFDAVSGLGGQEEAQTTIEGRLGQYQFAWNLLKESPIFGVDAHIYMKMGNAIDFIHSLWFGLSLRGGVVALIVICFWFFWSFNSSMKFLTDSTRYKEALVVTAFFSSMLLAASFYPAHMVTPFWFMFGIVTSFSCLERPQYRSK